MRISIVASEDVYTCMCMLHVAHMHVRMYVCTYVVCVCSCHEIYIPDEICQI
jgi:hypothetical protein